MNDQDQVRVAAGKHKHLLYVQGCIKAWPSQYKPAEIRKYMTVKWWEDQTENMVQGRRCEGKRCTVYELQIMQVLA